MGETNFGGLRVLALESRREKEIASLIRGSGGVPTVVPVMREVPLESNHDAFAFAQSLLEEKFDVVVFLTGAGARILFNAVLTRFPKEQFRAALIRTTIVVRGPKPVAALREFGVAPNIVSPSPSTWREVLVSLDAAHPDGLQGLRIAVQEYGAVNQPLLEGLGRRGALVTRVPVYQWALPDDLRADSCRHSRPGARRIRRGPVSHRHPGAASTAGGRRDAAARGAAAKLPADGGGVDRSQHHGGTDEAGHRPGFPSHPTQDGDTGERGRRSSPAPVGDQARRTGCEVTRDCANQYSEGRAEAPSNELSMAKILWWPSGPPQANIRFT